MIPAIEDMDLIHTDDWATYEEGGELEIYQYQGRYFYREGASMVFSEPDAPYWDDLAEISEDKVIELIEEWEEINKNMWTNMF